jgi:hypothetical protein
MPIPLQHLLVVLIVGISAAFVVRQGFLTLRGRKSKLGSCGSCGSCGSAAPVTKTATRTQFIPLEMLGRRK